MFEVIEGFSSLREMFRLTLEDSQPNAEVGQEGEDISSRQNSVFKEQKVISEVGAETLINWVLKREVNRVFVFRAL